MRCLMLGCRCVSVNELCGFNSCLFKNIKCDENLHTFKILEEERNAIGSLTQKIGDQYQFDVGFLLLIDLFMSVYGG